MYDFEFPPAVSAIVEGARKALDQANNVALRDAISRHLHEIEEFNKLTISGELMRAQLVSSCRTWLSSNDDETAAAAAASRSLTLKIFEQAQWFAERY